MTTVLLSWEVTEEVFNEKFTYDYLSELMTDREHLALMVICDGGESIEQRHFYKSSSQQIYIGRTVHFKPALNLLKEPKKISS